MNDLISRSHAIEVVRKLVHDPDMGEDAATFGCMIWGVLDRIPAADAVPMDFHERCLQLEIQKRISAEKAAPKWISVKDRLPADDGHYLCYTTDGYCNFCVYYGDGEWMILDQEDLAQKVTHWMPLPEPPKDVNS